MFDNFVTFLMMWGVIAILVGVAFVSAFVIKFVVIFIFINMGTYSGFLFLGVLFTTLMTAFIYVSEEI